MIDDPRVKWPQCVPPFLWAACSRGLRLLSFVGQLCVDGILTCGWMELEEPDIVSALRQLVRLMSIPFPGGSLYYIGEGGKEDRHPAQRRALLRRY